MPRPLGYVVSAETKARIAAARRARSVARNARAIALLNTGMSRADVAERMCVSVRTVDLIRSSHRAAPASVEGDGWRTVHCSGTPMGDVS